MAWRNMPTTASDDQDNGKPNIFEYATKELSQDAMICWLIKWSEVRADTDEERALKSLGRSFVNAMLSKHKSNHNMAVFGEIETVEIHQQDNGIDVLARVKGEEEHVLLIEDKTGTKDHGDQLERYYKAVLNGKTALEEVSNCCPIYLKTGNHSLHHARDIKCKTRYKVFNRQDFLTVLDSYEGDYPLVSQFRSWLRKLENEFNAWCNWKSEEREKWLRGSWEGFFRALENEFSQSSESGTPGSPDWDYVPNAQGGFLGFWWSPFDKDDNYPLYLQLEVVPYNPFVPDNPSRQRLCFKVARDDNDKRTAEYYHQLVCRAAERENEMTIDRPRRMRTGATMTVGGGPDDWLVFADGRPDPLETARILWRANRILEAARNLEAERKMDAAP